MSKPEDIAAEIVRVLMTAPEGARGTGLVVYDNHRALTEWSPERVRNLITRVLRRESKRPRKAKW